MCKKIIETFEHLQNTSVDLTSLADESFQPRPLFPETIYPVLFGEVPGLEITM